MSIDEAIAHAREVVVIQKNNDKLNKTLGKSSPYYNTDCIKCAEEHDQLAEWLEELKKYKECEFSVLKEDGQLLYKQGILDGYDKAVDDFVNACKEIKEMDLSIPQHFTKEQSVWIKAYCIKRNIEFYNKALDDFIHECDKYCGFYTGNNKNLTREDMLNIAEQLKVGGENDKSI